MSRYMREMVSKLGQEPETEMENENVYGKKNKVIGSIKSSELYSAIFSKIIKIM